MQYYFELSQFATKYPMDSRVLVYRQVPRVQVFTAWFWNEFKFTFIYYYYGNGHLTWARRQHTASSARTSHCQRHTLTRTAVVMLHIMASTCTSYGYSTYHIYIALDPAVEWYQPLNVPRPEGPSQVVQRQRFRWSKDPKANTPNGL